MRSKEKRIRFCKSFAGDLKKNPERSKRPRDFDPNKLSHPERKRGISQSKRGSHNRLSVINLPMRDPSHPFGMTDYSFCAGWAGSFFGWRLSNVICLIRAESDGLQVAMSGSSLKAL